MGFLQIIKLLLALLPDIMTAVKTVEAAVPQAGAGAQKLQTVLSAVQGAALIAPTVYNDASGVKNAVTAGDVPNIASGLAHMIGSVVSLFNATGAFQKSGVVQAINATTQTPPPPLG